MEISKLCLSCCETTCLKECLGRCPHAFVVALEWCHEEAAGDIGLTLGAISSSIDLSVIYGALHQNTNHVLVSMLCHSEGSHFTCFTLENGSWMFYDAANKEVAGLWENVKDICVKRVLKPQILLFAEQE
ncbi:uncharacterized protein [Aegilops tauschii subsp. strangulata]|uniref:USP domain-containing protein n=4 Tax=Aegilops tauschii TaxID=37682 RepID=A0A453INP8_AEGTS